MRASSQPPKCHPPGARPCCPGCERWQRSHQHRGRVLLAGQAPWWSPRHQRWWHRASGTAAARRVRCGAGSGANVIVTAAPLPFIITPCAHLRPSFHPPTRCLASSCPQQPRGELGPKVPGVAAGVRRGAEQPRGCATAILGGGRQEPAPLGPAGAHERVAVPQAVPTGAWSTA